MASEKSEEHTKDKEQMYTRMRIPGVLKIKLSDYFKVKVRKGLSRYVPNSKSYSGE